MAFKTATAPTHLPGYARSYASEVVAESGHTVYSCLTAELLDCTAEAKRAST